MMKKNCPKRIILHQKKKKSSFKKEIIGQLCVCVWGGGGKIQRPWLMGWVYIWNN